MKENYLKAIVDLEALNRETTFMRYQPSEQLKDIVDLYWSVTWDLREGMLHTQKIIPNPHINLVHYDTGTYVEGVMKKLFEYKLEGKNEILGVKFKVGVFQTFTDIPMRELTNQKVDVQSILPNKAWDKLRDVEGIAGKIQCLENILIGYDPLNKLMPIQSQAFIAMVHSNPSIKTVEALAEATRLSVRTLQRVFEREVGVNPKWIIRTIRLQELKEESESDNLVNWAEKALELGYADQAHMINDFKAFFGMTPVGFKKSVK